MDDLSYIRPVVNASAFTTCAACANGAGGGGGVTQWGWAQDDMWPDARRDVACEGQGVGGGVIRRFHFNLRDDLFDFPSAEAMVGEGRAEVGGGGGLHGSSIPVFSNGGGYGIQVFPGKKKKQLRLAREVQVEARELAVRQWERECWARDMLVHEGHEGEGGWGGGMVWQEERPIATFGPHKTCSVGSTPPEQNALATVGLSEYMANGGGGGYGATRELLLGAHELLDVPFTNSSHEVVDVAPIPGPQASDNLLSHLNPPHDMAVGDSFECVHVGRGGGDWWEEEVRDGGLAEGLSDELRLELLQSIAAPACPANFAQSVFFGSRCAHSAHSATRTALPPVLSAQVAVCCSVLQRVAA